MKSPLCKASDGGCSQVLLGEALASSLHLGVLPLKLKKGFLARFGDNMKSYMISLLVIGIALGGLGLGTFAYFTDSDTQSDNVVSTGNLDLTVWTLTPNKVFGSLAATDLAPGEEKTAGYVFIRNDGTVDLQFKAMVVYDDISDDLRGNLITYQVILNPTDYTGWKPSSAEPWGPLDYVWGQSEVGKTWFTYWDIDNSGAASPLQGGAAPNEMEPGVWQMWEVKVRLDETAGNTYESKTMNLDLVFDSTQSTAPGWV